MSTINIMKKKFITLKDCECCHTIPFCSMFCLTDFEWETVHSLPLFKQTDQSHSGRSDEKKNTKGKATILRKG